MAGTISGGKQAAKTNKEKYGDDFYKNIGSIGGKNSTTGGFFANRELASIAGRKGGLKSKRGKILAYERKCECINPPADDGHTTCWKHHDCSDGSCTHQDGED